MLHNVLKLKALAFLAILASSVSASQVMERPAGYKSAPRIKSIQTNPNITHVGSLPTQPSALQAEAKASIGYFTQWGIYSGYNFQAQQIPTNGILSHVVYAFFDVDPSTGHIFTTDNDADAVKHYDTDSWTETGNNVYGSFKQLYLKKLANRTLKTVLSVGGWTYSQAGHFNFVTSASARAQFVTDAVQLIEDNGFDGLDIDYEYPTSPALGQGFADLLTALRTAFNALQSRKGDATPYILSAAVAAGASNYQYLVVPQMNAALTYWNLMAYDYAGSWSTVSDNQANMYGGAITGFNTQSAIDWYVSKGATKANIILGMPLYGRAFEQTNGLRQPFSGIGPGTVEAGVYSYKYLPIAGSQIFENLTDISSYSYSSAARELVSYDTPNIVKAKAQYVNNNGMGGSMFWELSTDKVGTDSLVGASAAVLGALDSTLNHISYPDSKWDNIKNNMGGATATTTGTSTPTGTPGSGQCASVPAWTSSAIFVGGNTASYNGHLWLANWWTQNEIPGVSASGVWTDKGAC